MRTTERWVSVAAVVAMLAAVASPGLARGETDACVEWRVEHRDWKIEALQATLRGRPQAAIDETIFEVLQREAYLTSCETAVPVARAEWIGWRLAERSPDQYGAALLETVLAQGGFDFELAELSHGLAGMRREAPPRFTSRSAAPPLRPWRARVR